MQWAPTRISQGGDGAVDTRAANSYDFIRFCAASAVLFSHHFDLSGLPEPKVPGFGEDFGEVGVEVFFCLSGFLICRSLQKSPGWRRFITARVLRIYPTLALALVASSAGTFIWYRNYPNLWPHIGYVGHNLVMFATGVAQVIPGIFADAVRQDVNDPLWTLPYELWCYAVLALAFVFGVRKSAILILVVTVLFGTAWAAQPLIGGVNLGPLESFELFRLGSYFMSGAVVALLWRWIGRHAVMIGAAGLLSVLLLRNLLPIDTPLHSLALAVAVVGLGSSGAMAWFSKGGDPSYGMYVLAWPIQQFVLLLVAPFWLSLLAAYLTTAALGYATWHAYEARLMAYPRRLAQRSAKLS